MSNNYYYSFKEYLSEKYGTKVRRISLDAGFGCPNKDGTKGVGGCVYCNEFAFSPFAGKKLPLDEQINSAMKTCKEKGLADKFIAYFQNATNTYADTEELKNNYDIIKKYPDIVALYISTRPDCIDTEKLELIASYKEDHEVWIEYGVQTVHDKTLKTVNRRHLYADSVNAIEKTHEKGIKVCAHVILGLPGETPEEMMQTAKEIAKLPVSGIKLHVMHVLRDTPLEKMYDNGDIKLMEEEEYVKNVCNFLENIPKKCVIMRLVSDANKEVLIAPQWINNKLTVIDHIQQEFTKRGTCQGFKLG